MTEEKYLVTKDGRVTRIIGTPNLEDWPIDREVVDVVTELNRQGFRTEQSCAGHGSNSGWAGGVITFESPVRSKDRTKVRRLLGKFGIPESRFSDKGKAVVFPDIGISLEERHKSMWPSRQGKFTQGQRVVVLPSRHESIRKRYPSLIGREGTVVGWKRIGTNKGQSEYRVLFPDDGKKRWIYADTLEEA